MSTLKYGACQTRGCPNHRKAGHYDKGRCRMCGEKIKTLYGTKSKKESEGPYESDPR